MKYYKLVLDNTIIGAVTSNNFIRFSNVTKRFVRTDEKRGEYIEYNGVIYRSPWMRPIVRQSDYIEVLALEITEEEYNIFMEAIKQNEIVYDNTQYEEGEDEPENDPVDQGSIDFIRQSKIAEMSHQCRKTIEAGIDVELRGEMKHFSLDTQDQLNLMSLGVMAQTQEMIPYHADGESCIFYTAEEISQIVSAATNHKVYHTTYYNALKNYINSLETIEEIAAIEYGTPIPEEYKTEVLKVIEQ